MSDNPHLPANLPALRNHTLMRTLRLHEECLEVLSGHGGRAAVHEMIEQIAAASEVIQGELRRRGCLQETEC